MSHKSWHLDRRTFLVGSGVALGLPWLEGMASAAQAEAPRRLFCGYFPFGVTIFPETHEHAEWGWWPIGAGRDFRFSKTLRPLEPHRDEVTFFAGFQHDRVKVPGHGSSGFFLTGADTRAGGNTVSLDQVAAAHLGQKSRIPSLVLSTDAGVGSANAPHTLSFTSEGRPIPAQANPAEIFQRLFGEVTPAVRRQMAQDRSMLDLVLESSRGLERRLGSADRRTLEEYLASVKTLESDVERAQSWLDTTRVAVAREEFNLEATAEAGDPRDFLRVMYDLVFHAFRTDTTRVATFQTGSMATGVTLAQNWPRLMGFNAKNAHNLAHSWQKEFETKSAYDAALVAQFAHLIGRLKQTREGDATLLERTLLLYGSSNSRTHVNLNYPLVLAGGRGLGLKPGQYLKNETSRPLADIHFTMLQGLGVPSTSFADSTGPLTELRS